MTLIEKAEALVRTSNAVTRLETALKLAQGSQARRLELYGHLDGVSRSETIALTATEAARLVRSRLRQKRAELKELQEGISG